MKPTEAMKKWIAGFIRNNRRNGCISIHVRNSGFNKDFQKKFKCESKAIIGQLIEEGFLMGGPAKGGFSIWLPEDVGKGKRKPFSSRSPKNGSDAKGSTMTEKKQTGRRFPVSTINPETGQNDDLLATARVAVAYLAPLCEQGNDGRYIGSFSFQGELEKAGFKNNIAQFMLFLQHIGLVNRLERRSKSGAYLYHVFDPDFLDLILTEDSVRHTLDRLTERDGHQREIQSLKKKLEKLEASPASVPTVSDKDLVDQNSLLAEMAEMVSVTDDLRNAVKQQEAEVKRLKAELEKRPPADPMAVARALVARAKGEMV